MKKDGLCSTLMSWLAPALMLGSMVGLGLFLAYAVLDGLVIPVLGFVMRHWDDLLPFTVVAIFVYGVVKYATPKKKGLDPVYRTPDPECMAAYEQATRSPAPKKVRIRPFLVGFLIPYATALGFCLGTPSTREPEQEDRLVAITDRPERQRKVIIGIAECDPRPWCSPLEPWPALVLPDETVIIVVEVHVVVFIE